MLTFFSFFCLQIIAQILMQWQKVEFADDLLPPWADCYADMSFSTIDIFSVFIAASQTMTEIMAKILAKDRICR